MPIFFLQMAFVVYVILFSYLYSSKSIGVTCAIIFVFQLIATITMRTFNYSYFGNPLGFNPLDSLVYDRIASLFYHSSFRELNMFLDTNEIFYDDRGILYFLYFVYQLAGSPDRGVNLAVFFNVVFITASSYYVYRISERYMDQKSSIFAAFVWGTQLYASYTATVGLKENIMVFFVVASLYFIVKLWNEYTVQNVIMALFLALFTLLFRTAIFYMLVCCLLAVTAVKFPFIRKYIVFFIILILVIAIIYFRMVFNEINEFRGDQIDYDTYQGMIENKKSASGGFSSIVNFISAFIGPLPNVVAQGDKSNYITMFSFSSFCKTFYSFFFIYSVYRIIRTKDVKLLPLVLFWAADILMLMVTFFTLHDRYHWPHVPVIVILSVWGGTKWIERPPRNGRILYRAYVLFLFVVLIMFNYR